MRAIKFRVWHIDLGEMIYDFNLPFSEKNLNKAFSMLTNPIMQFTGLFDKNGKEIYEGDIMQSSKNIKFRVDYATDEAKFIFVCKNIWGGSRTNVYKSAKWINVNCEIIGNIYENPELLK